MLVCAAALVGGANAQVTKAAHDLGTPGKSTQVQESILRFQTSKNAAKDEAYPADTVGTQSVMEAGSSFYIGITWMGKPTSAEFPTAYQASWTFPMGTGWLNKYMGSGEIGYSCDFTEGGWYNSVLGDMYGYFNEKYLTGVMAEVGRMPSTKLAATDSMPLYFKHYTNEQVGATATFKSYSSYGDQSAVLSDLIYPTDPDKANESEVVLVPCLERRASGFPGTAIYGAKFPNPKVSGENTCVSAVFPHSGDEKDTLWNATLFPPQNASGTQYVSDRLYAAYMVVDFDKQRMWGTEGESEDDFIYSRERGEGFLPDEGNATQPNTRYAVLPIETWTFQTGETIDGEPILYFILADEVAVKSANPVDKYVEVAPIPAVDKINVNSVAGNILRVDIYSMSGQLVKSQKCGNNSESVSVAGLQTGMYVARIYTEEGFASKKIVVR